MAVRDVITIGNTAQDDNTSTFEISQFCTIKGDTIGGINLNREENEDKIVEELNTLFSQEEKHLTGDNINRIQKLFNKLPFEEKRIEMTYRKDEILKLLKVKMEIQDIENYINGGISITKVKDLFLLINKYMEVNKINKINDLTQIENSLIKLHNDKFEELLNKENYSLKLIDDNIEKYEELKIYINKLQKNLKFVSNGTLKDAISDEINAFSNRKNDIGSKILKLLNCDELSLDQSIKLQKLINTINNSNSPEKIDIALIENNFIDYINLGQKKRKKALSMFMEKNHKKYITIAEVNKDLDVIVRELNKQRYGTDTIDMHNNNNLKYNN